MRLALATLALLAAAAPLRAQARVKVEKEQDPTHKVSGGVSAPGWRVRVDDKDAKRGMGPADVKFVAMGNGHHVTSGPAAIYYDPKDVASGEYTVSATFTQTRAPAHPEAYGLFVGGADLPDTTESYLYFLVRGDGKYLINHRAGTAVHKIVDWTANPAVKPQDAKGTATNALAIHVGRDSASFLVNGKTVRSFSRAQLYGTMPAGQAGIRVNHNLDVHIGNFVVKGQR